MEYWSLIFRSLKATLRGADFRMEDVALLMESLQGANVPEHKEAQDGGATPTQSIVDSPSVARCIDSTTQVYVACTPYHLVLTRAMQMSNDATPALLILADEAGICTIIPEMLDIPGVFRIVRLRPIERHPQWLSASIARINARTAVNAVRKYCRPPDPIFFFNGARPEAFALHKHLRKSHSFHYVEDGLNAYLPQEQPHVSALKKVFFYCAYGSPHPQTTDLISMFPFAGYHYLVPDLHARRPPLRRLKRYRRRCS